MKGALLPFLFLILLLASASAFPLVPDDAAIQAGLGWFEGRTHASGCIGSAGGCSYGSTVYGLLALSAVGIDPAHWPRGATTSSLSYLEQRAADAGTVVTGCRACEWAKAVVVTAAIGRDPRTFGGIDAVAELDAFYDGVQVGSKSQINDDFWALYAYRAAEEPADSGKVQNILSFLQARQNADGGWAWDLRPVSDSWATPSAILALHAHGIESSSVAIQRGLSFLKTQQAESGLMLFGTDETAEQTAVSIQAITAIGDDPTGPNWTRGGHNLVSALLGLQRSDGGFAHSPSGPSDWMATWQSLPALPGVPYPYRPPTVTAHANPPQSVKGNPIAFECSATDPDGTIERVEWRWGDGTPPGGPISSHAYAIPGTYQAECLAIDDDGVPRTHIERITISSPTTATSPARSSSSSTSTSPRPTSSSTSPTSSTSAADSTTPSSSSPSSTLPSSSTRPPSSTSQTSAASATASAARTAAMLDQIEPSLQAGETQRANESTAAPLEAAEARTPGPATAFVLALLVAATTLVRRRS